MKKLKCRFKGLPESAKLALNGANGLLTISIGQDTQNNKRFIAMLDLMMDTFSQCTIALHDTLQRFTIAMQTHSTPEACYHHATLAGDAWLTNNLLLCEHYSPRIKIIRWDNWLHHPDFEFHKKQIIQMMTEDDSYKQLFHESINYYLDRYTARLDKPQSLNKEHAKSLCLNYLIEECAALCLWPTTGAQYEVYDGTHNSAMQETRKRFIHKTMPDKVQSLKIVFNHRPDLKPQKLH